MIFSILVYYSQMTLIYSFFEWMQRYQYIDEKHTCIWGSATRWTKWEWSSAQYRKHCSVYTNIFYFTILFTFVKRKSLWKHSTDNYSAWMQIDNEKLCYIKTCLMKFVSSTNILKYFVYLWSQRTAVGLLSTNLLEIDRTFEGFAIN